MNSDIAIKVENVSKTFKIPHEKISSLRGVFVSMFRKNTYEEFQALDSVSFEVKKGEFFGIIGRNGSGKSTLLKILAGIYQADKGKVHVNGLISPFLELGIGFNPELSGRDNVYLNATILGMSRKDIDRKFNDIVAFSELERFIDQKLKNYSSGMQVRLAFSVAIHANREILLMDEVLAVGDSNFQYKCLAEFNKYRGLGKTVILVTHDMLTAQKYCDRLMLLRNGKIQMIGNPQKVGNEYIYQNMSDEEKRILEEEKERNEKDENEIKKTQDLEKGEAEELKIKDENRWGNGDILITKVEILGEDEKVRKVFNPFEDVKVRVFYEPKKKIAKAVFGIELFNESGYRLFGFNTSMNKTAVEIKINGGHIDFKLKKVPFVNGRYNIVPAIANETCSIQYDYWKNADQFTIMDKKYNNFVFGDVNIDLEIDG